MVEPRLAVHDDSSRCTTYEVFLSFRGEDTRKSFTDHLYTALKWVGIHTFRDDDGMNRGGNIDEEIERAIRHSKISIIVFSKGYASSTYCLQELMMIKEHRKAGHILIPVFYDVDPSHVRDQSGSFAEAFAAHEKCFEEHKVVCWRETLREVADLAGLVLGERSEAQFIQDIVKELKNKLKKDILYIPSHIVGVDSHVKRINLWLQDELHEAGTGIIYGIGGIGKTTIAKIVYNINCNRFEAACFLANVRETAEQHNGLVLLQRQLLKNIVKVDINNIDSVDEGVMKIKDAICCKKVLIILDDVVSSDQFNMILGMRDWCYPGSKIIITTRLEGLLDTSEVCKKFELLGLDPNESLQLFSWHAFRQAYPCEHYMEHSKIVVSYCCGLPLALVVLGCSLSSLSLDLWERALQEPEAIDSDGKIQEILRISYDSLHHSRDKSLFLDMACFFIGKEKSYVDAVLEGCDLYRPLGVKNLMDRCLITIDKNNRFIMHQLLRDMARGIVHQESEDPRKRSRLWRHKDSFDVLRKNTGGKTITSLVLDLKQANIANNMNLKTDAFKKMRNLKLLALNDVRLNGSFENFPKGLVWLCWHQFSLSSIPNNLCLDDLIVLDMQWSILTDLWKETRFLRELRILDLSHCHYLVTSPDFAGMPNLKRLVLEDCIKLVKVHESIGCLDRLVFLSLKDCTNLRQLPKTIGMLHSLKKLDLSGCLELIKHKSWIFHCTNGFQSAIRTRQYFSMWSLLQSRRCLKSTSFSLSNLPYSLTILNLSHCNISDDVIFRDFSCLPFLTRLDLRGNPIQSVPESIKSLNYLYGLYLVNCKRLQSLPVLPPSLMVLDLFGCKSLQGIGVSVIFKYKGLMSRRSYEWICWNYDYECTFGFQMSLIHKNYGAIKVILAHFEYMESIRFEMMSPSQRTLWKIMEDCGIFNYYLPGQSLIPNWFTYQEEGSSLNFVVPQGYKTCVLNLCILVRIDEGSYSFNGVLDDAVQLEVYNATKDISWRCLIPCSPLRNFNQDSLLLCKWKWKWMDGLESGDQVEVKVFQTSRFYVKRCGVHLILIKKEQGDGDAIQPKSFQFETFTNQEVSTYVEGEAENYQSNNTRINCWIRVPLQIGTQGN